MSTNFQEIIKIFDSNNEQKTLVAEASRLLQQFRTKFPFRQNPSSIETLKPEDLWEKESGDRDSFFYWLQYKLKDSGHLYIGSKLPFENAIAQIDEFRHLLKIVVDDGKRINEKVDAPWENISGLGGDKHIVKKIIYCYNPEKVTSVFKTEALEHFCKSVGFKDSEIKDEALARFGKLYENLTVGETWELLNALLLGWKNKFSESSKWDNSYFSRFLYEDFSTGLPPGASEVTSSYGMPATPLNKWGLLFAPRTHEEVVYLFSLLHREIKFPYIVTIQEPYPDITAINDKGEIKKIEIELFASQFAGHDPKGCDYLVCWENDLDQKPADYLRL
jgi:hypothetical protein